MELFQKKKKSELPNRKYGAKFTENTLQFVIEYSKAVSGR